MGACEWEGVGSPSPERGLPGGRRSSALSLCTKEPLKVEGEGGRGEPGQAPEEQRLGWSRWAMRPELGNMGVPKSSSSKDLLLVLSTQKED